MPKVFLDTNVLLYAADQDEPARRAVARDLLRAAADAGEGVISTQVAQEFYVGATKKLAVEPLRAKAILAALRPLEIVTIQLDDINRAMDGSILWQLSFWDALILIAAAKGRCSTVYSEDLNPGQLYEGVRVVNPFV